MRNLNSKEIEILHKKEKRMGKRLDVNAVEYRKSFPRATVCVVASNANPNLSEVTIGITMRGKGEPNVTYIGEVQAYVRALNAL
jgi:hypothetical protein